MAKLPFTFTDNSLSVFIRGSLQTIPASHPGFKKLVAHLGDPKLVDHDELYIAELLDKRELVSRMTSGLVIVVGDTVYFRGVPVRTSLTEKLLGLLDSGLDAGPWARFLDNLMQNPSERSKECLYNFLERYATPLTPDGCFVAFKYVRDDYKDARTGTFDNSPGQYVSMPREDVDDNPNQTCSSGLHVCASHYLEGYTRSHRVIAVKVNPKDVVAVPTDYQFAKMRVCAYEVMGDAEGGHDIKTLESQKVVHDQGAAKRSVAELPEELQGLTHCTNAHEFYELWEDVEVSPYEGELVRAANGYTVGIVLDIEEGETDAETYYDDDLEDWVDDEDSVRSYWEYRVLWQTGIETTVYEEDGDDTQLITVVPLAYPDEEDAVAEETVEEPVAATAEVFKHEATGVTVTPQELKAAVEALGQREYSRQTGIPRSTLQGWLASL